MVIWTLAGFSVGFRGLMGGDGRPMRVLKPIAVSDTEYKIPKILSS